jgi:hypothetical protein
MASSKGGFEMLRKALSLAAVVLFAAASTAMAQGTITHGNAAFRFNPGATQGSADFFPDGIGTTDHLFQNWWWFRVDGAPSETPMNWPPSSQSYVGNTAILGAAAPGGQFSWELELELTDGAAPGQASVVEWMSITNLSTFAPLSLALYNYVDYDMGGSPGGDSATLIGPTEMEITDGSDFARFVGVGADAYQVTSWSTLRAALLDGGVTQLSDTGLPFGPGDFTGAFQWNLTVPAGETVRVREDLLVNMVPEPASFCLLTLGSLALLRRRG